MQVTPLGPVPVKGLSGPVEVCELVGAGPARTRLQVFAARGLTPFVGRQAELTALYEAMEQAEAGHGQVVAVIGEPGVGKTRLFHEFTHASRTQGWLLLESSSTSYGKATPYLPVIGLLKAYFQIEDRDDGRRVREKLTGRLPRLTRPSVNPAGVPDPPGGAGGGCIMAGPRSGATPPAHPGCPQTPAPAGEPGAAPLAGLREPPLDRHRDPGISRWSVGEPPRCPPAPARQLPPRVSAGWGQKTYYTQLRLDPLPPASAEALLQSLLGDDPSLEPLKQRLIERTQGNPFFLEESMRTLVETQVLVGNQGAYCLARALPSIQVPSTVQAVLAARIDRLPRRRNSFCKLPPSSARRCPWRSSRPLPRCLRSRSAWASPICRPPSSLRDAPVPDMYTFKHALTQQVAYETLLQERRRALHARIVAALEALAGERAAEQVERLAHHALRGEVWDKRWHTAGRRGEGPGAVGPPRGGGVLRAGAQRAPHLPEQRDTREQAIDLRLACDALRPLGDSGVSWRFCARPRPRCSPRRPASAGQVSRSLSSIPTHGRV